MSMSTFTFEGYRHMRDHAGFSYDPTRETPDHGQVRCAVALARAEMALKRSPARVEWEVDHDADTSWLDQTDDEMGEGFEAFATERKREHERGDVVMMGAILYAADGNVLTSLWGIELSGDWERDPYRRVIEAELAHEVGRLALDPSAEDHERVYWAARDVETTAA
jgi:hypothetical protein